MTDAPHHADDQRIGLPDGRVRDLDVAESGARLRAVAPVLLCGILVLVGVIYIATIRSGHDWGGDFSMYVKHAANLVEGRPYWDTGYIYVADGLSPRAYPPVFPVLLAPVYAAFGLDLEAFKVEIVLLFVAMLAAVYQVFKGGLPTGASLILVALVGFSPYFADFKNFVRADIPFMLFLYLATAFLTTRCYEEGGWRDDWRHALLAGVLVYLAVGVKTIGLSLVVAIVLLDLLRWRRISRFAWIASSVVGALLVLERTLITGYTGQAGHFSFSVAQIVDNLVDYSGELPAILLYEIANEQVANIVAAPISLLALFGYYSKARRNLTLLEILPVVYCGVLLFWPFHQSLRYVAPLFPLYLYYAFAGIQALGSRKRLVPIVTGIVAASIAGVYLAGHLSADYGPLPRGVDKRESRELFEFIRTGTGEDDVIVFRKPRILALYTGRRATYDKGIVDDRGFRELLDWAGVSYVVTGLLDKKERLEIVRRNLKPLHTVFQNDDFAVLRVPGKR